MQEITIKDINYRTGQLSAKKQFHVARKLAPLFSELGHAVSQARRTVSNSGPGNEEEVQERVDNVTMTVLGPIAECLAKMSEEDTDYILNMCLSTCMRQTGANGSQSWTRLTTPSGDLMFDDVDMGVMLQLVYAVIEDNLGNFFQESLQTFTAVAGIASPQSS